MKVIELTSSNNTKFNTGVALGNFDGIHIGHQELIKTMVKKSKENNLKPSLLLFKEHTKSLINSKKQKLITSINQKIEIVNKLGVEVVYLIDFNEDLMKLSGEEFLSNFLVDQMNVKFILVGFDYKFGHKASCDANDLIDLGKKYKIKVDILSPIYDKEEVISSSNIRKLINLGEMKKVSSMLKRNYSICGKVISGEGRGSKLGFPTANIEMLDNYVVPKNGVYFTNTIIDNLKYISATSVGYNPTFNKDYLKIETYILDFDSDIYGKNIEIEFLDYIRDDIKFDNIDSLIKQIDSDIEWIRNQN